MLTITILIILIVTGSAFVRSFFGFGLALTAMPLLALVTTLQVATPLAAMLGTTIGFLILWRNWREVDVRAAWKLVLSSCVGIPFGLIVLKTAPDALVKGILGVIIMAFGAYSLFQPKLIALGQRNWAYIFGFIAGIMGGAYNTSGPVVILYGTMRRWTPPQFRASMQGYFVPTGTFIFLGHGVSGLWTPWVLQLYLLTLPTVLIAYALGEKYNGRVSADRFEQLLYIILIIIGFLLLI